jgi:hypothetical protein
MVLKIATYHNDKMIESVYGEIMNNNYKFAKIKPNYLTYPLTYSNLPEVFHFSANLDLCTNTDMAMKCKILQLFYT